MLRSLKDLQKYIVRAKDGDVGTVADLLLDDEHWAIRYLVVEAGTYFNGKKVLITPLSFREVDWATQCFHLDLTRDRVRDAPGIEADEPVSTVQERRFHRYFNYPYYGDYTGVWGYATYPGLLPGNWKDPTPDPGSEGTDIHLRSAAEVTGYDIQGRDEPLGSVRDFIVDDETWQIRYLVVDTGIWWFGKSVLVAPRWATHVDWAVRKIYIAMTRAELNACPEWDATAGVNREYEARLYDYHGRPAYWSGAPKPRTELPGPA